MYNYDNNYIYDYENSQYDDFYRQRYCLDNNIKSESDNISFLFWCGFFALIYLNRNEILRNLFSNNDNTLTPLSCTYKYLFNYNTDDLDSDDDGSDDDVMDGNVDINQVIEVYSDSNSESYPDDIVNKSKYIFLTTNYDDVMKNCNNPFYKDNDIKYYLTLEKREDYIASSFILTEETDDNSKEVIIEDSDNENDNDNSLINVTKLMDDKIVAEEKNLDDDDDDDHDNDNKLEFKFLESTDINELHVFHNEINNDKRINLPYTWKINCEDDKYINFIIEEKKIDDFFSNLLDVLRCYYSDFKTKYQNLNVIYNENSKSPVLLNQANSSFKNDEYITYNLLNIRDLYAYTNQETKILNYDEVNLNNKELKEYYSKTIEDLTEETLKTLFKQIY